MISSRKIDLTKIAKIGPPTTGLMMENVSELEIPLVEEGFVALGAVILQKRKQGNGLWVVEGFRPGDAKPPTTLEIKPVRQTVDRGMLSRGR